MLFGDMPQMNTPATHRRRHRRLSKLRRAFRRRWFEGVVTVGFTVACVVALLLLLDVIDRTIAKPDRGGIVTPRAKDK